MLALGEHEREGKENFWGGPLWSGTVLVDCALINCLLESLTWPQ